MRTALPARFCALALVHVALLAACSPKGPESDLGSIEGTFAQGGIASDTLVTFIVRNGDLLMQPALWSGPMVLQQVTADSFVVAEFPRFGVRFQVETDGAVQYARVHGLSQDVSFLRSGPDEPPRPVQLLMNERGAEAADAYFAADPAGAERFVAIARRYLRSFPTRTDVPVTFLGALARLIPTDPDIEAALGDALVFARRRPEAAEAYRRALALDAQHEGAIRALERMGTMAPSSDEGLQTPFALEALFAEPQQAEIDSVWARWQRRDLEPREVEVILRREVDLGGVPAEARVISHRVHGLRHVGVVIVPHGARPGEFPVLVEAKGVSASFFPLEVPGGLTSPGFMGEARGSVIYVAPGYRGEQMIVGADTLASEGDRSDAWDGATDDTIALLRAALGVTPEADPSRICVFGRSRGGAVALLTGMREPQVDCVVSWAAPTDWFTRMGLEGWSQRELVEDGLRHRAVPGETGGQFINYFLSRGLAGQRDLAETRLHLIASSPLYFAERLPRTQAHWGLEDAIVPSVNGEDFVAWYRAAGRPEECLDARFHPDAGHDQDRQLAPQQSRDFLLTAFGMGGSPGSAECRE